MYHGDGPVPRGQGDLSLSAGPAHHLGEDAVDGDGFVGSGWVCHFHRKALAILHSNPRLK